MFNTALFVDVAVSFITFSRSLARSLFLASIALLIAFTLEHTSLSLSSLLSAEI